MQVTGQITMLSTDKRTASDSMMQMTQSSTSLRTILYTPTFASGLTIALTNVGRDRIIISSKVGIKSLRQITLEPKQMTLFESEDLSKLGIFTDRPQVLTVQHTGHPEDLIATGSVYDNRSGFSSNIFFEESTSGSSHYLGSTSIPIGERKQDLGIGKGANYTALLSVANTDSKPTKISPSLTYKVNSKLKTIGLTEIELQELEAKHLNLNRSDFQGGRGCRDFRCKRRHRLLGINWLRDSKSTELRQQQRYLARHPR